jgi:phosphatidylserine decarboxylase
LKQLPIHYFDRYTKSIETEIIYGEPFLRWAYGNPFGRLSVQLVAKRHFFSHWYGWRMNQPATQERITPFVKEFQLDASEFVKSIGEFLHFNDFFSRELKPESRPIDSSPDTVVFPADGRHLGFQDLSMTESVFVKGQRFDLNQLFLDRSLAERYQKGSAVLSRLCPTDYHRFHFATAGTPSLPKLAQGPLYSVSPLALRQHLSYLWQNKRMITQLETENLGLVTIVEFGATNVGSIHQTFQSGSPVSKGQEKGYFSFGGSATMTFFEPDQVRLMPDLIEHSQATRELYARMGDVMATHVH